MDKEIKAKWIAALRSGDYKQGRGMLKQKTVLGDIKYCCLGVLCEIMEVPSEESTETVVGTYWSFAGEEGLDGLLNATASFPHQSILDRVGLDKHFAWELAGKNDTYVPFPDIATMIEVAA